MTPYGDIDSTGSSLSQVMACCLMAPSHYLGHYLNQWWLVSWRIYASLGLNELSLCNSFVNRACVDEIHGCLVFKWGVVTWPADTNVRLRDNSPSIGRQGDILYLNCMLSLLYFSGKATLVDWETSEFNYCSLDAATFFTIPQYFALDCTSKKYNALNAEPIFEL